MTALPLLDAPIRFAGKYTAEDEWFFPNESILQKVEQKAYIALFAPALILFLFTYLLIAAEFDEIDIACCFLLAVLALMIPWYHLTRWWKLPGSNPKLVTGQWCDGFADAEHVMYRHDGRVVRIPWQGITTFILTDHAIDLRTPFHWVMIPRHFMETDDFEELATLIGNRFGLKISEEELELDDLPDPSDDENAQRQQINVSQWKSWDSNRWPFATAPTDSVALHLCVRKTLTLFAKLWWKHQFKVIPAWACLVLALISLFLLPGGWLNLLAPTMTLLLLATLLTLVWSSQQFLKDWRQTSDTHSDMKLCREGMYNKSSFQEAWTEWRAMTEVRHNFSGVSFFLKPYGLRVTIPKSAFANKAEFVLFCQYLATGHA